MWLFLCFKIFQQSPGHCCRRRLLGSSDTPRRGDGSRSWGTSAPGQCLFPGLSPPLALPRESFPFAEEQKSPRRPSVLGFPGPPQGPMAAEGPVEGLGLAAESGISWDGASPQAAPKLNLSLLCDALNVGCLPNIGLADTRAGTCRGVEWITGTPVLWYPVINVLDLPRIHQKCLPLK